MSLFRSNAYQLKYLFAEIIFCWYLQVTFCQIYLSPIRGIFHITIRLCLVANTERYGCVLY